MGRRRRPDSTRAMQTQRVADIRFLASLDLTPPQIGRVLGIPLAAVKAKLGRDANRGRARRDGAT